MHKHRNQHNNRDYDNRRSGQNASRSASGRGAVGGWSVRGRGSLLRATQAVARVGGKLIAAAMQTALPKTMYASQVVIVVTATGAA